MYNPMIEGNRTLQ